MKKNNLIIAWILALIVVVWLVFIFSKNNKVYENECMHITDENERQIKSCPPYKNNHIFDNSFIWEQ